jgi:hypothetical protein
MAFSIFVVSVAEERLHQLESQIKFQNGKQKSIIDFEKTSRNCILCSNGHI